MRQPDGGTTIDTTDEAANVQAVAIRQANKTITVSSSDPLDVTITSTGIEVRSLFFFLLI